MDEKEPKTVQEHDVPAFSSNNYAHSTNYPHTADFAPPAPATINNENPTIAADAPEPSQPQNTEETITEASQQQQPTTTNASDNNNVVMGIPLGPEELRAAAATGAPSGLTPAEMMMINMQAFHGGAGVYGAENENPVAPRDTLFPSLALPSEHMNLLTSTYNLCKSFRIYAVAELISIVLVALSYRPFLFLIPFPVAGFIGARKYHFVLVVIFLFCIPFLLAGRIYNGVGLFKHYEDRMFMRILMCCVISLSCFLDLYVAYVGVTGVRFLRRCQAASIHGGAYGGFILEACNGVQPTLLSLLRIGWTPPPKDPTEAGQDAPASNC